MYHYTFAVLPYPKLISIWYDGKILWMPFPFVHLARHSIKSMGGCGVGRRLSGGDVLPNDAPHLKFWLKYDPPGPLMFP